MNLLIVGTTGGTGQQLVTQALERGHQVTALVRRPPRADPRARRPETAVVIIGAGFYTRAFRLPGGRWVELDEPALITLKEARLPAREAPNPLTRVAIRFEHESLEATLAPFRHLSDPVVVLKGGFCRISRRRRYEGCYRRYETASAVRPSSAI